MLLNSRFVNYEIITTPGLHFLTYLNQLSFQAHKEKKLPGKFSFFQTNEYWNFLIKSNEILENYSKKFDFLIEDRKDELRYEENLILDCANGIPGFHFEKIKNIFKNQNLNINFINILSKNYSFLSNFCGADYVLKDKLLPITYPTTENKNNYTKNISLDADAVKIVYL